MPTENNNQPDLVSDASNTVMGDLPVWFINSLNGIVPGFARRLIETEYGISYKPSGLDLKTRELVLMASCGAVGAAGIGALRTRIPAALEAGATRMEVLEVLVQIGFAAGLPTSVGALQTAAEVFAEIDASKA